MFLLIPAHDVRRDAADFRNETVVPEAAMNNISDRDGQRRDIKRRRC